MNNSVDKVAMGVARVHGFQQGCRCLAVKMASCDLRQAGNLQA